MEAVDRGKQILVLTIDIGDGRQDFITVYEHDNPKVLSQEFANKYGLNSNLQKNLHHMIQENVKEVLKNELHLKGPDESDVMTESEYLSPMKTENPATNESKAQKSLFKSTNKSMKNNDQPLPAKGSIYGALYKQLRKNETSKSVSSISANNKSTKTGYNYGDYLYAKGLKDKQQAEKFKEMKKQELFEKEIHNYTFSPLINTNSSLISPRVYEKPENILIKRGVEKQEKIQKLKENTEKEIEKECYFVPKINKNSKSRNVPNIHAELYNQAEQRKDKRNGDIESDFKQWTFKPEVGNAHKKKGDIFENTDQFLDRLETSKRVAEEEMKRVREDKEKAEIIQVQSMKPRPSYDKSKISRHNSEPVWDYLYGQRDAKKKELLESQKEFQKTLATASISKKTSQNSDKIFADFRQKQFQKLFETMDSDRDGVISSHGINISTIETSILRILTPFFEEIQKTETDLNFQDFLMKMEELYKNLNVEEKAILIKRPDPKEEDQPIRKPVISARSSELADKKREKLPSDFYERQTTLTKMNEMKVLQKREEKEKIMRESIGSPIRAS
jgi:hypothetical protein